MAPTLFAEARAGAATVDVRELLEGGQRLEFTGAPARALRVYRTAEALADTPTLRAESTRRVGDAHRARGEWAEAQAAYAQSLAVAEGAGLTDLAAEALNAVGSVAVLRSEVACAAETFERGLRLAPGDRVRGMLLQNSGLCALERAERARAAALFVEALDCFRRAGYRRGELMALNNLGALHVEDGDPGAALGYLAAGAHIARDLMDLDLLLLTVQNEAEAYAKLGRLDEAEERLQEAIGHFNNAGNERRLGECLVILGDIYRARGGGANGEVAARCYERARALALGADAAQLAARAEEALRAMPAARG